MQLNLVLGEEEMHLSAALVVVEYKADHVLKTYD
jgi:hypothetical protein